MVSPFLCSSLWQNAWKKNLKWGEISLDWKFFVLVMSKQGLLHDTIVFWTGTGSFGVVPSYLNHHQTLLVFRFITRPLNHWVLLILSLFIFPIFFVVVVVVCMCVFASACTRVCGCVWTSVHVDAQGQCQEASSIAHPPLFIESLWETCHSCHIWLVVFWNYVCVCVCVVRAAGLFPQPGSWLPG